MHKSESAFLWLFKIAAGLVIVILLGVHFIVNHVVAPGGLLSYADVVRYYQVPGIGLMEIAFLAFVVSHALIGLRSILLDLNLSARLIQAANWILLGIGAGAILYGTWLVIVIQSRG